MSEVLDREMGKHAQSGVAWHFICILYFFKLSSSFLRESMLKLPNVMEI